MQHSGARFEVKFTGRGTSLTAIESWIRAHSAGFRSPYPPRTVNSAYFDTFGLGALEENLIGASAREKLRLRWYGRSSADDRSTLEVKLRKNKLGWKISYPLSVIPRPETSWRALQAQVRAQLPREARFRMEANPLVSLVNRYDRKYFVSGNGLVRLTLDTRLEAFDQRFGRRPRFDRPVQLPNLLVVEFKFSPENRDCAREMIDGIPLRVSRNSKYASARSILSAG